MTVVEINPRFEDYIFDWDHKTYFLVGGYGSSKSYNTAAKILLKCLKESRTVLVVRDVYATIRDSCFSLFEEIAEIMGIYDRISFSVSPLQIKFPNGAKIIFRGLDNPQKLKSINNVSIVWIEECSEIKYDGYKELMGRLRHPTFKMHMILTTNPVSKDNWAYLHFFKDEVNERLVLDDNELYEQKTIVINNTYYHHSTADDNLFLPQDYIDQLDEMKEYDKDLHRVARHGQFGINGKRVLPNFEMKDAAEINRILDGNGDKFMFRVGMDFGFVESYNAVVRVAVDKKERHLYIYWEYYKNGMTDDKTAKEIQEFVTSQELILADSAEPKTIKFYRQQKFNMRGAKKFPGSRAANTKKMRRFKKIFCSSDCPNVKRELEFLTFAKDRNGRIIEDEFNIDPHTKSAIWYALDGYEVPELKGDNVKKVSKRRLY